MEIEKDDKTNLFIKKAKLKHGDKYDYSFVEYKSAKEKVVIKCLNHGQFTQTPNSHLRGSGCYKCGRNFVENSRKLDTKEFIKRAKEIHGDRYNYEKSEYVGYKNKITIICLKHGEFNQQVRKHLEGQNCKRCTSDNLTLSNEEFIKRAKEIHGDRYNYEKSEYTGINNDLIITCLIHGNFKQKPTKHINSKRGCKKCGKNISNKEIMFLDEMGVLECNRNVILNLGGKKINVDGIDRENKIVYEFYGDYFHGNINLYNKNDINKRLKKTFGELYQKTIKREELIKSHGYTIISMWEDDFNKQINKK
jgi:hypothetical protein